jgi:beta-lactamase superfamily II metal-dependent hydrolase
MNVIIFPAMNGDSLFVETDESSVLIDGGYVSTYRKFIKPKLESLKKLNKKLNHLIVTHIDEDHISGIIKLIEENRNSEIIDIQNIWHNSYAHIKVYEDGLIFSGKTLDSLPINYIIKDELEKVEKDISAVQGSTLASLLLKHGYQSNGLFGNQSISVDTKDCINSKDISFMLLSPNNEKLLDLKKYWKKELYKKGYSSDESLLDFNEDAFEYILSMEKEKKRLRKKNVSGDGSIDVEYLIKEEFKEDDTTTNGSSIAFILECNHLKILLLGDSHPSQIIAGLKRHYRNEEFPVTFDLIKISHHGSKNNTSSELLNYIDSENFVISTNGSSHNHPDDETIARIICRKTDIIRKLYFNYSLKSNIPFKDAELQQKYNYQIVESLNEEPIQLTL